MHEAHWHCILGCLWLLCKQLHGWCHEQLSRGQKGMVVMCRSWRYCRRLPKQ